MTHNKQRGDAITITIITLLTVALIGAVGYIAWKNISSKNSGETQDTSLTDKKDTTKDTESTEQVAKEDLYEGWKTVKNDTDDFSLRYPASWPDATTVAHDGSSAIRNMVLQEGVYGIPDNYISIGVGVLTAAELNNGMTPEEWYNKLGREDLEIYPTTYPATETKSYAVNGRPSKLTVTRSGFDATTTIHLKEKGKVYTISIFPVAAVDYADVSKIISSFTPL